MTSFKAKLIESANKSAIAYFITALTNNGKSAWYYLQVEEPKHKAFQKQMETGALDLAQYGKILYSGWGTSAPEPIEALMKEKFAAA